jgi:hypothetical protein
VVGRDADAEQTGGILRLEQLEHLVGVDLVADREPRPEAERADLAADAQPVQQSLGHAEAVGDVEVVALRIRVDRLEVGLAVAAPFAGGRRHLLGLRLARGVNQAKRQQARGECRCSAIHDPTLDLMTTPWGAGALCGLGLPESSRRQDLRGTRGVSR